MQAELLVGTVMAFVVAITIERRILRRQARADYRFHDAITNLLLGLGALVFSTFIKSAWLAADLLLRERFHLFELPVSSPLVWLAGFVAVDHCYYWFHRAGHRINFLWAAHAVHHQSQDYNLSVALRQSWLFQAYSWFFFAPLILIGFPPLLILGLRMVQALYQYWLHTETIGKLGFFEGIFTTPSHHRVHHGRNPQYIDRNHGGILILWDRLYGTFVVEDEPVTFGTVSPHRSWNPLWANLAPYAKLAAVCSAATRLRDRLRIWVAPPEWLPASLGGVQKIPPVEPAEGKYDVARCGRGLHRYIVLRFAALAVMVLAFAVGHETLDWAERVAAALWLIVGMGTIGGIVERRAWVPSVELLRLGAAAALIAWLAPELSLVLVGAGAATLTGSLFAMIFLRAWRQEQSALSAGLD